MALGSCAAPISGGEKEREQQGGERVGRKREHAGQPKRFESGEELIALWTEYCDEIAAQGYVGVPTQTDFSRWLRRTASDADRRTIYTSLNKYFPAIKKEFERIRADTVATGTMLGRYQPSMSIFALKNWCGWTDKQEVGNLDGKPFRQSIDMTELSDAELMELAGE